ncbi:hypothetical protein HDU98_004093 [Podochytrium sp. JEL0797]|nr:hypothetical protein HDU98_004093 [Podochytrium sp. JEL0797]
MSSSGDTASFSTLPSELTAQILSWIPPNQVPIFQLLSLPIRDTLRSTSFAKTNLVRFHPPPPQSANPVNDSPSVLDLMLFKWPVNYQRAYAELWLNRCKSIFWSSKDQLDGLRIPESLDSLSTHLIHFHITYCGLIGEIPVSLMNLVHLQTLSLYGNSLSGRIPPQINHLTKLKTLNMYGNTLSGPIPAELGDLVNLRFLNLSQNALSGTVPRHLGNLFMLEELHLRQNLLEGVLPVEVKKLSNAYLCDFRFNPGLVVEFEFPSLVK